MGRGGQGRQGPVGMRRCVVCRTAHPKSALQRHVRSTGGVVVDPAQRAQGRGAYLCGAEACIAKAPKVLPRLLADRSQATAKGRSTASSRASGRR